MMVDVEVRSSGPGPREVTWWVDEKPGHVSANVAIASRWMGREWTREGLDYKGRWRRMADGVAIIIRRAE